MHFAPARPLPFRPALAGLALLSALAAPALAGGPSPACQGLYELYRGCNARGAQAYSSLSCLDASAYAMTKAEARLSAKNPQTGRMLVELVCTTGCEDAVTGQARATPGEFTEAFCDDLPPRK